MSRAVSKEGSLQQGGPLCQESWGGGLNDSLLKVDQMVGGSVQSWPQGALKRVTAGGTGAVWRDVTDHLAGGAEKEDQGR